MSRLRSNAKFDIDTAITAGLAPKASAGGVGLPLGIPGKKSSRMLVNRLGVVMPAGDYYYDQVGQEAPAGGFDFNQQATGSGQRHVIRLLDGSTRAVQIWNPNTGTFKTTVLGKKFFARAKDKYTVSFPVVVNLVRTNGSLYQRQDWLPSTALPS